MTRCLVIDDDDQIRSLLTEFLQQFEMQVTTANDARQARRLLERETFDVAVVDIMLPGESGLGLCKWINESSELPVILLTAQGDPLSKVVGLEMGADDYLAKPFEPRELVARIQAIIRRRLRGERGAKVKDGRTLHFAGWRLDRVLRQLTSRHDVVVSLSNAEFRLLSAFLERPGRVLNRDQLIDLTKAPGVEVNDRSIDLCISRLRQKMSSVDGAAELIRTVRGEGYYFEAGIDR